MLEVVRLKFHWNWPTPGRFTGKVKGELGKQSSKSQLFKVTNKGKPPQMLTCNLTKNDVKFLLIKISLKKLRGKNVDISTSKITSKKYVDFSTKEITPQKVRGNNVDFSISEVKWKK